MSLDQLTSSPSPSPGTPRPRRVPAWLLPVGLFAGFVAVFLLLFGSRLLPAVLVQTAPVVTLRTASSPGTPQESQIAEPKSQITRNATLLFQASGWIEPDPYPTYVPTLVNGVVKDVHVLEGQPVKKDQLLATLVEDDALLDVREAEQRIASTISNREAHCASIPIFEAMQTAAEKKIAAEEARLDELKDAYKRLNSVAKGAVPEADLISAKLQVIQQEAAVEESKVEIPRLAAELAKIAAEREAIDTKLEEAKTDLARKKLALTRTRIMAPIDGTVLRLHAAPGKKRMLTMDDQNSAVIVELYEPDKLQARIDVPLNEAAGLRIGQPVKLTTDLLPDLHLRGTVTRLVGEADLQRNTLQAKVRMHNPDPRLRPEMLVRAEFFPLPPGSESPLGSQAPATSPAPRRLALYAPKAGLFDLSGNRARAWIVESGRAQLRQVTVANSERDNHLLVADGLLSGDLLILPPHDKLAPNKRVTPTNL